MNIIQRMKAPTPKFFRVLRNIGLVLAGTSATLVAEQDALPAAVVQLASYLGVAGGVATAVSQAAVAKEEEDTEGEDWYRHESHDDGDDT
jgi:hypothetical protein